VSKSGKANVVRVTVRHLGGALSKERALKYAMFIVVDPEATEADDAAAPAIEDWFEYMIGKGSYLQGIRLQPRSDATTVKVRDGKAYQGRLEIRPIHSMGGPEDAERKGRLQSGRRDRDAGDGRLVSAGRVRR
jgi:hypothetical protein